MPTSGLVRAAAMATTEEVMEMFPAVFPDPIAERLPPLREYNHRIQLKNKENLKTQPTCGVPEMSELKLKEWLCLEGTRRSYISEGSFWRSTTVHPRKNRWQDQTPGRSNCTK